MGFLECEDTSPYCSYCMKCFIETAAIAIEDAVDILAVETECSGVIVGKCGACVSPGGVGWDNFVGDGGGFVGGCVCCFVRYSIVIVRIIIVIVLRACVIVLIICVICHRIVVLIACCIIIGIVLTYSRTVRICIIIVLIIIGTVLVTIVSVIRSRVIVLSIIVIVLSMCVIVLIIIIIVLSVRIIVLTRCVIVWGSVVIRIIIVSNVIIIIMVVVIVSIIIIIICIMGVRDGAVLCRWMHRSGGCWFFRDYSRHPRVDFFYYRGGECQYVRVAEVL